MNICESVLMYHPLAEASLLKNPNMINLDKPWINQIFKITILTKY